MHTNEWQCKALLATGFDLVENGDVLVADLSPSVWGVVVFHSLKKSSVCSSFHKLKQTDGWQLSWRPWWLLRWSRVPRDQMSFGMLKPSFDVHFNPVLFSKEGIFSSPLLGHLPLSACSLSSSCCSSALQQVGLGLSSAQGMHGHVHVVARTCLSLHPFHASLRKHLASLH